MERAILVLTLASAAGVVFWSLGADGENGRSLAEREQIGIPGEVGQESRPTSDDDDVADDAPRTDALQALEYTDSDIKTLISLNNTWQKGEPPRDMEAFNSFDVQRLVELAMDGDTVAARSLAQAQSGCRQMPSTGEEFEKSIFELRQTRKYDSTLQDGDLLKENEEQTEQLVASLEASYQRCAELRAEVDVDEIDFLQIAADDGHPIAMVEHGVQLLASDPATAAQYFQMSWEAGEPRGLQHLATVAEMAYQSGEDPSAETTAAAYSLAFAVLLEARYWEMGVGYLPIASVMANEAAAETLNGLQPYQRAEVVRRAQDIIDDNDNCCVMLGF